MRVQQFPRALALLEGAWWLRFSSKRTQVQSPLFPVTKDLGKPGRKRPLSRQSHRGSNTGTGGPTTIPLIIVEAADLHRDSFVDSSILRLMGQTSWPKGGWGGGGEERRLQSIFLYLEWNPESKSQNCSYDEPLENIFPGKLSRFFALCNKKNTLECIHWKVIFTKRLRCTAQFINM